MTKPKNLKQIAEEILDKEQAKFIPTSFDIVGDIMIFSDFPEQLESKGKLIGDKILESYKNIKVVCKKTGKYGGTFRTPKLKIIAGERRKETIHKENGIRVKLHVENVYFSSRLGHERERINKQVKKDENVLVMFSGCGVYPINISKNTFANRIVGVEINPVAHKYGLENVFLNKVSNVELLNGDVKEILPKLKERFDRVLMPLPKSAGDFLDIAISKVKKNGIIHFYDFLHENDFGNSEVKIKEACKRANRKCRILNFTKCGKYGPGKYRVCVDAKIQ